MVDFLHENGGCSSCRMMFRMLNCLVIFKEVDCNNEIEKTINRAKQETEVTMNGLF